MRPFRKEKQKCVNRTYKNSGKTLKENKPTNHDHRRR
jgi:hypothetical protein